MRHALRIEPLLPSTAGRRIALVAMCFLAVLAIAISARAEGSVQVRGLSPQSLITVVNERGVVLTHSADSNFWIGKNLLEEGDVQRMLKDKEGVLETPSFDGRYRLAGFSTVSGAPWLVFVGTPVELAVTQARDDLGRTLVLGGSMFVLALILATWIGGRTAHPLRQLAADASHRRHA